MQLWTRSGAILFFAPVPNASVMGPLKGLLKTDLSLLHYANCADFGIPCDPIPFLKPSINNTIKMVLV
jgi:hypothetical protein